MPSKNIGSSLALGLAVALCCLVHAHAGNSTTVKICEASKSTLAGGEDGGLVLPLFSSEPDWPVALRAILYFIGLIWTFLGVGIVSDTFMMAIEVITAKEKNVTLPDGATISVRVWNGTVANLTLMALGSSAPEILLSVIEIISAEFFSGELGPSTIVGSAAFNLLMIIAVCVMALPDGEVKKVDDTNVYGITASFSVFAYLWLIVILMLSSPDVVEPWEGILTFLFFPLLVGLAYGADRNWFSSSAVSPHQHILQVGGGRQMHAFECAELMKQAQQRNPNMSAEETAEMLARMTAENTKPSRAQLRMNAIREMTGGKRVVMPRRASADSGVGPTKAYEMVPTNDKEQQIYFSITEYAVLESEGKVTLVVNRTADEGTVKVKFDTKSGTATKGKDFVQKTDQVIFEPGETEKTIEITILDDEEVEEDEKFVVILTAIEASDGLACKFAREEERAVVTIIDDDEPGVVTFKAEDTRLVCSESQGHAEIVISRVNGSAGQIGCTVTFDDLSAEAGKDYTPPENTAEEDVVVTFDSTQITKRIRIPLIDTKSYEKNVKFKVVLSNPTGVKAALGEYKECIVEIVADEETKALVDTVLKQYQEKYQKYKVGTHTVLEQFKAALVVGGDEDDPDFEPGPADMFLHGLSLPWKLLFAFIPPTDFGGGWYTFCIALAFIGGVTAIIGDLASIFGCLIGLKDPVTAITFVALGTSLPDTFASKAAALADSNADASIGNVTGSNSVNVFLGLGMPWTIASLYWAANGATSAWEENFPEQDYKDLWKDHKGAFVVEAGSLGISVAVFSLCACTCIFVLYLRRRAFGGELGGPKKWAQVTFAFFAFLWFIYILSSALVEYS